VKLERYVVEARTIQKCGFHVTVWNTTALKANGVTAIEIGNIYGGPDFSANGLDALAIYAREEYLRQPNAFALPPASTAPTSGRYGVGEAVLNSAPASGQSYGWIGTVGSSTAPTFKPISLIGWRC
jgi:hypothetical protein